MGNYLSILVLLIVMAAVMRDDFAFTLVYLFVGAIALGTWWSRRTLNHVSYDRQYNDHAFLGEKVCINLSIRNQGLLPVPWLKIHEALPVALSGPDNLQRVTSLGPRADLNFEYELEARKRGYYAIGPLFLSTGDILGLNADLRSEGQREHLTVYPKIIPLTSIKIPSSSPQGTLRHTQPIFEDPTRVSGKREYVAGDSLRRVDWKSTASTGRMQVKLFEPSIALETVIFLNLNAEDYHYRTRIDATELAIVIAASMANWVVAKGQTLGMSINGIDPLAVNGRLQAEGRPQAETQSQDDWRPQIVPPRKGKGHLMRILEHLARVESSEKLPAFVSQVQQQRYHLSWGTTLIVITGQAGDDLLDELYQARRAGQHAILILAGTVANAKEIQHRASFFGIPVVLIPDEKSLDIWRR
jgi:uncharacterized protein (DUF58 family)